MLHIVLLGPPGAGKGTQAAYIAKDCNIIKLSTGDMLRLAVSEGSSIGLKAKNIMENGGLVDDEIIIQLIQSRIVQSDCSSGFILDGFPRTLAQATALNDMLKSMNKTLHHVIELEVDDAELVSRISGRFSCASCGEGYHDKSKLPIVKDVCDVCSGTKFSRRSDDNAETVSARLASYHAQTAPLIPYYRDLGVLRHVDGMLPMGDVRMAIAQLISVKGNSE